MFSTQKSPYVIVKSYQSSLDVVYELVWYFKSIKSESPYDAIIDFLFQNAKQKFTMHIICNICFFPQNNVW